MPTCQSGLLLFIGTRLVTHALSCVHPAFASCERSFDPLRKKRKVFLLPSPFGPFPQFRCVLHLHCPPPCAEGNLPPALGSFQPPPPAFCPHPIPTILHTLAILKTYIHLLPPPHLMLRLELSVLRCLLSFASSSHLCPPLFRCSVLAPLRPHYTHRKFPSRSRNHASASLP